MFSRLSSSSARRTSSLLNKISSIPRRSTKSYSSSPTTANSPNQVSASATDSIPLQNSPSSFSSSNPLRLPIPAILQNKYVVFTAAFLGIAISLGLRYERQAEKQFQEFENAKSELMKIQEESRLLTIHTDRQRNYRQQLIYLLERDSIGDRHDSEYSSHGPYKKSWSETIGLSGLWGNSNNSSSAASSHSTPALMKNSISPMPTQTAASATVLLSSAESPSISLDLIEPELIKAIGLINTEWRMKLAAQLRSIDSIDSNTNIEQLIIQNQQEKKIELEENNSNGNGFRM